MSAAPTCMVQKPIPISLSLYQPTGTSGLTPREEHLALMLEDGAANKDIAQQLQISEETVKRHISNIFDKSGMSTRLEFVVQRLTRRHEQQQQHLFHALAVLYRGAAMNFTKSQIYEACKKHAPSVRVPAGIDPVALMFAIAGVESSFGADCTPRHEPSYDLGGYFERHSALDQELIRKYGHAGACSYGPWQVMLASVPKYEPIQLAGDLDTAAQAFVDHMNGFVLGFRRAATVQQIAETYNSGDFGLNRAPGVLRYAEEISDYYSHPPYPTVG